MINYESYDIESKRNEAIYWLQGDSGCTEEQTANLIDGVIKEAVTAERVRITAEQTAVFKRLHAYPSLLSAAVLAVVNSR